MVEVGFLLLIFAGPVPFESPPAAIHRPQRYAIYKAHTILPESLKFLVRKNGKVLFEGLHRGLQNDPKATDSALILRETERITQMVNQRRRFRDVIFQMGYVAGLVAVYTNPVHDSHLHVQRGFAYYLNLKLPKYLFVFDGYPTSPNPAWLRNELEHVPETIANHSRLLNERYRAVKGDSYYPFTERSAVFGVCSLYFSNLARLSAHLWYQAWTEARGDLTKTPFSKKE